MLRGGAGVFWLPGGLETSGSSTNNPTATISTPFVSSLDSGVTPRDRLANPFPNGLIPLIGRSQGLDTLVGQSVGMFIRGAHQAYVNQWKFDVQQQLGGGLAVEAAYAGSHGVGLPASIQANQIPDAYLNLGTALNEQVSNPFYGLVSVGTLSQRTVSRGQLLRPSPQFTGVSVRRQLVFRAVLPREHMLPKRACRRTRIAGICECRVFDLPLHADEGHKALQCVFDFGGVHGEQGNRR